MSTTVTAAAIQNGSGGLLSSGTWKFAGQSLTVTSGAISGSVTGPFGDVLITDASGNHLLHVPNVNISGAAFDWDNYVQPSWITSDGLGAPYLLAQQGAQYIQTNAQGASRTWVMFYAQGSSAWVLSSAPQPTPTQQAAWQAPAASQSLIQRASVLITSAQILAMTTTNSNPIQIVAAPGPGLAIIPLALFFQYIPGSIAYTDGGFTFGVYPAGNAADSLVSGGVTATVLGMAGTASFFTTESDLAFNAALSKIENLAWEFSYVTDVGAVVSAGNGNLVVTMLYDTFQVS